MLLCQQGEGPYSRLTLHLLSPLYFTVAGENMAGGAIGVIFSNP